MYNILIWGMCISQTLEFLQSSIPNFLSPFFFPFFSAILFSLLFAFHILSGCHKKLGVNFGQSLEMGP